MKAIAIFDIPDDYDEYGNGDWYIMENDYGDGLKIVYEEDGALMHYKDIDDMAQLKPMPTKKVALFDPNHCDIDEEIKIIHEIDGYNRCIDKILGEEAE